MPSIRSIFSFHRDRKTSDFVLKPWIRPETRWTVKTFIGFTWMSILNSHASDRQSASIRRPSRRYVPTSRRRFSSISIFDKWSLWWPSPMGACDLPVEFLLENKWNFWPIFADGSTTKSVIGSVYFAKCCIYREKNLPAHSACMGVINGTPLQGSI